jgi:hypothetical protein
LQEAQALARQQGVVISELSLPRESFDALKDECRHLKIATLDYTFVYEPKEQVILLGMRITPEQ